MRGGESEDAARPGKFPGQAASTTYLGTPPRITPVSYHSVTLTE
jgi:hypothetical protein